MGILAQAPQIIVCCQSIGIFIAALDGFTQILKRVLGMVGSDGNTGERIPHREAVALPFGIVLLLDHVAKQFAGLGVAMGVRHRCPELLQCKQCIGMLRAQSTSDGGESLSSIFFTFCVAALPDQVFGKIGLTYQGAGMFRTDDANHGRERLSIQLFRFVDMPFLEEFIRQPRFGEQGPRVFGAISSQLNRQRLPVQFLGLGMMAFVREQGRKIEHVAG